jgi:hypothetical protein
MDSKVLQTILDICIPILTALFVPFVIALIKQFWANADASMAAKDGANWALVKSIVVQAVNAAEQAGVIKAGETIGQAKLQYATQMVQAALAVRGIKLDLYPIVEMIEAAVMQEFNCQKVALAATQTSPQTIRILQGNEQAPAVVPVPVLPAPAKVA